MIIIPFDPITTEEPKMLTNEEPKMLTVEEPKMLINIKVSKKEPINILICGWFNTPHSYAIVNCFQILNLYNNYGNEINFYISERLYYNPAWPKKLVFDSKSNKMLSDDTIFKKYDPNDSSIKIKLIYRIVYKYDITASGSNYEQIPHLDRIPIIVFYTSEFSHLTEKYFSINNVNDNDLNESYIVKYINDHKNLYFTGPSKWSTNGINDLCNRDNDIPDDIRNRNRTITHGVDTNLLRPIEILDRSEALKKLVNRDFKIDKDDIVFLNIGSMTGNKGISLIIQVLNILVNRYNRKYYKLILKGSNDLYNSENIVKGYLNSLKETITKDEIDQTLHNICFIFETLSYEDMAILYNIADLYVSPYFAEGFNLTPLEALACGTDVIVPKTGSTKEYITDIYDHGGSDFITTFKSKVLIGSDKNHINDLDLPDFLNSMINYRQKHKDPSNMIRYISERYSWSAVSDQLFEYFDDVIKDYQKLKINLRPSDTLTNIDNNIETWKST